MVCTTLDKEKGKPAVRHLRGDDGNGGIIRSPIRAIVLPDPLTPAREYAGSQIAG
jgi:hypothetical protein